MLDKDKLKTSIDAIKSNIDLYMNLYNNTNGVVDFLQDDRFLDLENAFVLLLDEILPGEEEASIFIYDYDYGNPQYNCEVNLKSNDGNLEQTFKINSFDDWYEYLIALENIEKYNSEHA